ncbi:hypothetical protein U9M48_020455 [Paspalum notatum var. saurae]|uniref:Uncharacterized protein n=1 Tax=Paspalum notatum var. saurae TaxID=547442 RepID=A0AAQ3TI70_PASNO
MSSVRGNRSDVSITEYEQQQRENIARNKEKFQALKFPIMTTMPQPSQPNKRRKKTHHTSAAAADCHNLRSRAQRNCNDIANVQNVSELKIMLYKFAQWYNQEEKGEGYH